jgi:GNAT superfamily N-acetyltransferase
MNSTSAIARLRHYHREHGFRATLQRIGAAFRRAMFAGKMAIYSCDLPVTESPAPLGTLILKRNEIELDAVETNRICSHWNPKAARKLIEQRFAAGAQLWLLRSNGQIAAYGWTLRGKTMEPYFFPLEPQDVHLFDFFVFPEFRGRKLNPSLVWQILEHVGREGSKRALIEAAVWNRAQLSSLTKTPFKKIGIARKFNFGKSTFVSWSRPEK